MSLISLFRRRADSSRPKIPVGRRIYAIGDVHGCVDLFNRIVELIEDDDAGRSSAETTIILLGDLIDRGPHSAQVLDKAMSLATRRKLRIIAGNHEQMLLASFGDIAVLRQFLQHGGRETLLSYALDPADYARWTLEEVQQRLPHLIPERHRAFVASFEDHIAIGDYLFVHAGVRPGIPLAQQSTVDLRWIRSGFLDHDGDFGAMIVHGHTVTPKPELRHNRIGLDTGAYRSGRLTAIGLEGAERWLLTAEQ